MFNKFNSEPMFSHFPHLLYKFNIKPIIAGARIKQFIVAILMLSTVSCKKSGDSPTPSEPGLSQFHKSITIGENYMQQPQIAFASANSSGDPDIFYEESTDNEHTYLKWTKIKENGEPVFKKMLQPPGSSDIFWQTGFAKKSNNEYVLSGSWWEKEGFGNMFIATVNESGQLLQTKIVSSKDGNNTVQTNKIFTTRDNGFIATDEYPLPILIKLDANVVVQWSLNLVGVKSTFRNFVSISNPAEDKSGNIFIALTNDLGSQYLIKLDASSGNIIWAKEYNISNLDAYFSPFNMKHLVIDEENNLYIFSEYHFTERILIIKTDKDGNGVKAVSSKDDCRDLFDMQYINQNFLLLTGTFNTARCMHMQMDKNLEIQKKGVVLSAGDLSTLPGKFIKSKDQDYTSFLIAGPDENDKHAWQYVRLDNNWKYPCFNYTIPEFSFANHSSFETKSVDLSDLNFYKTSSGYVTTEAQFQLTDFSVNNMYVIDYCK